MSEEGVESSGIVETDESSVGEKTTRDVKGGPFPKEALEFLVAISDRGQEIEESGVGISKNYLADAVSAKAMGIIRAIQRTPEPEWQEFFGEVFVKQAYERWFRDWWFEIKVRDGDKLTEWIWSMQGFEEGGELMPKSVVAVDYPNYLEEDTITDPVIPGIVP